MKKASRQVVCRQTNSYMLHKFARMNSRVKTVTKGGAGETRMFLDCGQKCDQAKCKALAINLFPKILY